MRCFIVEKIGGFHNLLVKNSNTIKNSNINSGYSNEESVLYNPKVFIIQLKNMTETFQLSFCFVLYQ